MSKDKITELEALFPTEPVPKEDALVRPFEGDPDRNSLKRTLSGKKWTSVSYDYIRRYYTGTLGEAFIYLKPEAKAYFLPAFLRICDGCPRKADTLPEVLLSSTISQTADRDKMLSLLNAKQRDYLLRFFERTFSEPSGYADQLSIVNTLLTGRS
jgi:hypothetical protein